MISESQDIQGLRVPINAGIAGFVARSGDAVNVRDAHDDPRFDPSWDERTGFRTMAVLCMPVKDAEGNVVGCLQVQQHAQQLPSHRTCSPPFLVSR